MEIFRGGGQGGILIQALGSKKKCQVVLRSHD